MASERTIVYYGADSSGPPEIVTRFGRENGLLVEAVSELDDVRALINRSFPACVAVDAAADKEEALDLCRSLKEDAFTAIVPVVLFVPEGRPELPAEGLAAGADEVITREISERERELRLELVLRRAARDVSVHPTTRLPGTVQIERDLAERLASGKKFAVCYADLDHFKEFNDRYGYNHGDGVILLVSKILRDLVRALAPGGFVGHIGGDDFIFNVDLEHVEACCDEIITLFDELIPYQYTEEDRKAGYFLGKDRRGSVHRVALMSLSIGVVTNQFQTFTHTAQISELSAEMKTYAKTLPGSLYVVDRRQAAALDEATEDDPVESPVDAATPATS